MDLLYVFRSSNDPLRSSLHSRHSLSSTLRNINLLLTYPVWDYCTKLALIVTGLETYSQDKLQQNSFVMYMQDINSSRAELRGWPDSKHNSAQSNMTCRSHNYLDHLNRRAWNQSGLTQKQVLKLHELHKNGVKNMQ